MNGFREYTASPEAVRDAEQLGMGGNVAERLTAMARRSAICTEVLGNRRFDEFLMDIHEGVIRKVSHYSV